MRIEKVRIENFRAFEDVEIPFDDYTCLVGANGAGKSTIINALNIFFREDLGGDNETGYLHKEDFHKSNTENPVQITVTFIDLNADAQKQLSHYYRNGKVVITAKAIWDDKIEKAPVSQHGQRDVIEDFTPFFEAIQNKEKVAELKNIYTKIRESYPDIIPPGTKSIMEEALINYQNSHPDNCKPQFDDNQFYGFTKGINRIEPYIQWVYVPAVKDAYDESSESKNTALGKLLGRTVRAKTNFDDEIDKLKQETDDKYNQILNNNQFALDEISVSLGNRLSEWAHPNTSLTVAWQRDNKKSVKIEEPLAGILAGEVGFEGSLSRLGHGLQRSYLLSILIELADCDTPDGPTLLLACEEPELYQHPPQIRHLAEVFEKLTDGNNQVVVCTHSPTFVVGKGFENVRIARKSNLGVATVDCASFSDVANRITKAQGKIYTRDDSGTLAKISQQLQPAISEIFFAPVIILVEGLEDVAYISTYLKLSDMWSEFRKHGCHLVPTLQRGKSSLMLPFAIAKELNISTFLIFDADGNQTAQRESHQVDNKRLLKLAGCNEDCFPSTPLILNNLAVWPDNLATSVKADFDERIWEEVCQEALTHFGTKKDSLEKNTLYIARTLEKSWGKGERSKTLMSLCDAIITFASS